MPAYPSAISPRQLFPRLTSSTPPLLLDVRTPVEHRETHLPGVELLPLDSLKAEEVVREHGAGRECVVICRSGARAARAAAQLATAGMKDVRILEGGMLAWNKEGLPASHGAKMMSLERQVRIAAGALGLTGALLAQFVNPAFIWLSGFVGAGLMFAGITDTCAMGMLIAKAPWKKVKDSDASCCTVPG